MPRPWWFVGAAAAFMVFFARAVVRETHFGKVGRRFEHAMRDEWVSVGDNGLAVAQSAQIQTVSTKPQSPTNTLRKRTLPSLRSSAEFRKAVKTGRRILSASTNRHAIRSCGLSHVLRETMS